jgi:hypothetical protein
MIDQIMLLTGRGEIGWERLALPLKEHLLARFREANQGYLSGLARITFFQGNLIQEGTHDSLMQEGGEYAAMFTLQAERYRAT